MARPERHNVDYFPFLCKEGKALFYIESTYGNDGFSTWIKILRQLAVTNFHYLNLNSKADLMFLSSKCKVSESILKNIINDLCELGEFDKELWENCKVVWSDKFIESIQDAYTKRNSICMNKLSLSSHLLCLGIIKPSEKDVLCNINPQTILKDNIEDKTKEDIMSIIELLNSICFLSFKPMAEKNKKPILARLKEGFKVEDFKTVIEYKNNTWGKDEKMKEYLRPETLFGTKFESYLQAAKSQINQKSPIQNTLTAFEQAKQKMGLNGVD